MTLEAKKPSIMHKGKLNLEDVLTSNVYGFLEVADRRRFLTTYLRDYLKLKVSDAEAIAAVFEFWPTYSDGTEPDVVVVKQKSVRTITLTPNIVNNFGL